MSGGGSGKKVGMKEREMVHVVLRFFIMLSSQVDAEGGVVELCYTSLLRYTCIYIYISLRACRYMCMWLHLMHTNIFI